VSDPQQNGERGDEKSRTDGLDDGPPLTTRDGETIEDLGVYVDAIRTRLNNLEGQVEDLQKDLDEEREERQRLEEENEELREKLQEVDQRTDLLRMVKQNTTQEPAERQAVLIQTLINEAQQKAERGESAKASLTPKEGRAALGNNNHRSLIYQDFRDAVDAVGDEEVLKYKPENRGQGKDSRLRLNLEAGDLPDEIGGYAIDKGRT
jgi:regulator of replication initiation timing